MNICSLSAAFATWTCLVVPAANNQAQIGAAEPLTVHVTLPAGSHEITRTTEGDEVFVDGLGYSLVPGTPRLPAKIFAVAIPPGAEVTGVRCDVGEGVRLPGTYKVPPASLPRVIGGEDGVISGKRQASIRAVMAAEYAANLASIYGSDDPYPSCIHETVRVAGYRKYNLVDVRVTPFAYRPLSGQLTYYPEITLHVDYEFPEKPRRVIVDNLARPERTAREIILNYEQTRDWYPSQRSAKRAVHDFVIITLDSLTSSVAPLADWETVKGRNVEVVTTSWIDTHYDGYDLAESMRNFLRDKYPSDEWGIEDVLLVGHYDDVPMRRTAHDIGWGQPETDFYYAELSLPDDQSWDADGDHQYGEYSDPIDFYAEVNVGRIPWSTPSIVASICDKSIRYEQNYDPAFKQNILLLGSFFWEDTDNAELMEAKVDQPWMSDWTMTRMYEQNDTVYSTFSCDYEISHANVLSAWSSGQFAFVNWAGHGSPISTHMMGYSSQAFIRSSDCSSLNDTYPAIIFADACSNSDTDHLNIGQAMLQQGAVGFVGATKVAFGRSGWDSPYDGSSQSMDYFFTTCVTSGNYTQGQAHQWALREMYTQGLWYYNRYETFEWGALWGNPALGMTAVTDCDGNGIRDECDVDCGPAGGDCDIPGCGTGTDCDGNGFLDACQPDCNSNGIADPCDITGGTSDDCTGNGTPDECEPDCNNNGVADSCDIAGATSRDCNNSGVPDECELAGNDCNVNDVPDECDIAAGTSADCNWNGIPDVCIALESDCNNNNTPDECDISAGTSEDCQRNDIPDECDIAGGTSEDCTNNGIPDECDVAAGTSLDCNANIIPDECDLDAGTALDCNTNGIPDDCDIADRFSFDCNTTGVPDECEIRDGASADCNDNGCPDECDIAACTSPWNGFQTDPPFVPYGGVHGIDSDGDGVAWDNPSGSATIRSPGCQEGELEPGETDQMVRVTAPSSEPEEAYVASEYFLTDAGELPPDVHAYALSFRTRIDVNVDSKYDWEFFIYDALSGEVVVHLEFASHVGAAGDPGYVPGHILVNTGSLLYPQYADTGVSIELAACYALDVVLDNTREENQVVEVYVNGALKVTTKRLQLDARRMDYFHLEPVDNGASATTLTRFILDKFDLCVTGMLVPPSVYDCNDNGVLDECDISAGTSEDADSNGVPDECEGCPYIYDLDNSCFVDAADLGLFAACWLLSEGADGWEENDCADKDFDCSGTVDATDLGLFAGAWLKSSDEFNPADYPECRVCGPAGIICP